MASQLMTPTTHQEMIKPDPEVEAQMAVSPLAKPRAELPNPEDLIHLMRESWAKLPKITPRDGVTQETSSYRTRDATKLKMLVYRPTAATEALPLLIWYHGGGMCVGNPEINFQTCQTIALEHNVVVIAPQYRLAPEFPYPIGRDDTWDALKHIHTTASEHQADPSLGLVLGGESAGAVISSLLALQARDDGLNPPVTGTWLSAGSYLEPDAPPEDYKAHYLSRRDPECMKSPMLSETAKKAFDACLKPDYSSPKYRAALCTTGQQGLGKTYFQTCGLDISRDDSFIYRDILARAGVPTKLDAYPGSPHCFWLLFPDSEMGRKWKSDTHEAFKWLFDQA